MGNASARSGNSGRSIDGSSAFLSTGQRPGWARGRCLCTLGGRRGVRIMSTMTFTRCSSCGGINSLDEHYKCSNCGAITEPHKAVHIKTVENDDGHVRRRSTFPARTSAGTYVTVGFSTSYAGFDVGFGTSIDVGFGTSIDDFDSPEDPGSKLRIKGLDFD